MSNDEITDFYYEGYFLPDKKRLLATTYLECGYSLHMAMAMVKAEYSGKGIISDLPMHWGSKSYDPYSTLP